MQSKRGVRYKYYVTAEEWTWEVDESSSGEKEKYKAEHLGREREWKTREEARRQGGDGGFGFVGNNGNQDSRQSRIGVGERPYGERMQIGGPTGVGTSRGPQRGGYGWGGGPGRMTQTRLTDGRFSSQNSNNQAPYMENEENNWNYEPPSWI
jgi:hypothetical protein